MRAAQQARRLLKGHRMTAAAVECIGIAAGLVVPLTELAALRLTGLGAENVVHASALWHGGWLYALLTVGLLVVDWLLLSPLLLGRMAFYWHLALGDEAPIRQLFAYYGRRYTRALRWRFSLSMRRLLWGGVCFAPAALATGFAEALRRSGANTPIADVTMLFCTLFGLLLLISGFLASEMLMLRYLPAAFLLIMDESEAPPKRLFRRAARSMRGHVVEMFWLYAGFTGWFALCALFFPYFYVAPLFFTTRTLTVRRILAAKGGAGQIVPGSLIQSKRKATADTVTLPTISDKKQPC